MRRVEALFELLTLLSLLLVHLNEAILVENSSALPHIILIGRGLLNASFEFGLPICSVTLRLLVVQFVNGADLVPLQMLSLIVFGPEGEIVTIVVRRCLLEPLLLHIPLTEHSILHPSGLGTYRLVLLRLLEVFDCAALASDVSLASVCAPFHLLIERLIAPTA